MASWMVHLRIADKLFDRIPDLSPIEFVVGNIAPDSGVPNEDWSAFTPNTKISHFKGDSKIAVPEAFAAKYFTNAQQPAYSQRHRSFYLGYLVHLITDVLWVKKVFAPSREKFADLYTSDKNNFVWRVKEDWYDLDFKYLRDHPDFRAFQIYLRAEGFTNEFMDEFSADAFDNRRQYITGWYLQGKDNLDREYPYLTELEMDAFVESSAGEILDILHKSFLVCM